MATIDIYFIFGIGSLIVSTLTVVGHSLTIIAFHQVAGLTTNPNNLLILALSVTDLIFGINVFVYYGIPNTFGLGNPFGEIGCLISVFLDDIYIAGNCLLVALSVDRVMLVSMDYSKYVKIQTKSRIKWVIFVCCAVGFLNAVIETGLWNFAKRNNEAAANIDFALYCVYPARRMKWFSLYITFGVYCPPVIIIAILSAVFLVFLRKRMKKNTRVGNETSSSTTSGDGQEGGDVFRKRYLKPAITLGALVSAMAISMCPLCIYLTIAAFSEKPNNYNLVYAMWFVYELNPMLDAFFFAATQRNIKTYYWQQLVKCVNRFR